VARVREARSKKSLPGPTYRESRFIPGAVEGSFTRGRFKNRQVQNEETYYRYWGVDVSTGRPNKPVKVSWLVNKKYASEKEFRDQIALSDNIRLERVTTYRVPAGTWVSEGNAARKNGRPGGGYQAVVSNLPRAWKVREERPFQ
jgi:hypothetical protein